MLNDESGVQTLSFQKSTNQFIDHSDGGSGIGAINVVFFALFIEEYFCFFGFEVFGEGYSKLFLESLHHGYSFPGGTEIDVDGLVGMGLGVGMVFDDVASSEVLHHGGEHIFGEVHEIVEIGVGHVELAGCVFGVVGLINGLVSEVFAYFEDSLKTSYYAFFEEEFRGNSHVEFHIKIIVMGDKRSGCSSSRDHIHHGSLYLNEIHFGQVVSHIGDHFGPHNEGFPGLVVHDHIKVPFSVSAFSVLESCMGIGQHVQTRGEQLNLESGNGKFLGGSPAGKTHDSDYITSSDS